MRFWPPTVLSLLLTFGAATPAVTASDNSRLPFVLPVTFVGYAPCGDCGGNISITLRLEPDHTFSERDAYRRYPSEHFSGKWRYEYSTITVVLDNRAFYRVLNAVTLDPLDSTGDPFQSRDYRLTSTKHRARE